MEIKHVRLISKENSKVLSPMNKFFLKKSEQALHPFLHTEGAPLETSRIHTSKDGFSRWLPHLL